MPIVRYGDPENEYDFTASTVMLTGALEDNFKTTVEQISPLPGAIGAFSSYGMRTPPVGAGEVRQGLTLVSQTNVGMDALRDALNLMQRYGVQPLFKHTSDYPTKEKERYCMAYIADIRYSDEDGGRVITQRHQPIDVVWRAPDPRWYAVPVEGALWGAAWGSTWGEPRATIAASGVTTDTAIVYAGKTTTSVKLYVKTSAVQTCENPTIQRIIGNKVIDEVAYTVVMGASETLKIDARRHTVWLNGVRAYDSNFARLTAGWLTLEPGTQTVRVKFANSTDAASVELWYHDAFK